jgi:hypothetical protein
VTFLLAIFSSRLIVCENVMKIEKRTAAVEQDRLCGVAYLRGYSPFNERKTAGSRKISYGWW